MCIKCKNREMLADVAGQVLDMSDALIDAFQLIEALKAKGGTLDEREQKCYDRLSRYVRGQDAEAPAEGEGVTVQVVTVDSPDQLDAVIQALQGRKPRSTH
ncbi:putative ribonucleotide-diphosphate reductase [Xanthomonas phage Langgrundblatt2]|uniref:Ribonucleotide-diphosphate reductase n=1 Tax=Xanthomonas phage Langgrundblatt2 TaxID=2939129 RepID=A0A9E7E0Y2_9CAUD|nr:putative ribonucleotide-diphosphate reductase [Xanthomonas phage Langgrundblatt2]URA06845.1 putative ribonucleotide-diphosphate reductase [Xanthomonas phage Langgrundblatt2]